MVDGLPAIGRIDGWEVSATINHTVPYTIYVRKTGSETHLKVINDAQCESFSNVRKLWMVTSKQRSKDVSIAFWTVSSRKLVHFL